MKEVQAGFSIIDEIDGAAILRKLEKIGRLCYKSEERISETSAAPFVAGLIARKHEAMLEHVSLSVHFTTDRGVTHEMVRHRLASFAQESTRYCNYAAGKYGNEITVLSPVFFDDGGPQRAIWQQAMQDAEKHYLALIEAGATPQEARTVLPNSTKAEIVITCNLREWRHILNLRAIGTTGAPHPQMIEVMRPLLAEFKARIPVVFDDLGG